LVATVGLTTLVWLTVTFVTRPVDPKTLIRFCRLVRPPGPGWKAIRQPAGIEPSPDSIPQALLGWFFGCVLVYSALFGAGSFIYQQTETGAGFAVIFLASAVGLATLLPSMLRAQGRPENPFPEAGVQRRS
jgi:hypothetical protein